jgi:hypothetical protein
MNLDESFKDFFNRILNEDALDNLEIRGDWENGKPYGYDKPSIKMMANPLTAERIKKKWAKLDYPVNAYIIKGPKIHTYTELGRVPWKFVRDKMKLEDMNYDDDAITCIFTNNKGAEKIPMTPWTLAHRLGHAMARDTMRNERPYMYREVERTVEKLFLRVAEYYGKRPTPYTNTLDEPFKKALAQSLGTFKSARDRNLRASFEFVNESIAQFIITGKITLNRDLPKILPVRFAWGKPQGSYLRFTDEHTKEDLEDIINDYENQLYNNIDALFGSSIGNIYVM